MLSKLARAVCLAIFALPLAAHAELPGEVCEASKLGTTKRADDDQSLIACLKTGEANPAYQWKSMTSGGGGQITGGCEISWMGGGVFYDRLWGKGCFQHPDNGAESNGGIRTRLRGGISPGYDCGLVDLNYHNTPGAVGAFAGLLLCIKK